MLNRRATAIVDWIATRDSIWPRIITGISVVVIGVLGWLLSQADLMVGQPLYRHNLRQDSEPDAALRGAVDMILETYQAYSELVVLAFGVVAFLATYQLKKGVTPTRESWSSLAAGLVLFAGALGSALLGIDAILRMIGNNAIDLGLNALMYARWAMYGFLVAGLVFVGRFAVNVVTVTNDELEVSSTDDQALLPPCPL